MHFSINPVWAIPIWVRFMFWGNSNNNNNKKNDSGGFACENHDLIMRHTVEGYSRLILTSWGSLMSPQCMGHRHFCILPSLKCGCRGRDLITRPGGGCYSVRIHLVDCPLWLLPLAPAPRARRRLPATRGAGANRDSWSGQVDSYRMLSDVVAIVCRNKVEPPQTSHHYSQSFFHHMAEHILLDEKCILFHLTFLCKGSLVWL